MSRRKILGLFGSLVLSSVSSTTNAKSLYGSPVSLTGPIDSCDKLLELPLNAPEFSQMLSAYEEIWKRVVSGRFKFNQVANLFESKGLKAEILETNTREMRIVRAMTDEEIIESAISGNYPEFFSRLKNLGVYTNSAESKMEKRLKCYVDSIPKNLLPGSLNEKSFDMNGNTDLDPKVRELLRVFWSDENDIKQQLPQTKGFAAVTLVIYIGALAVTYVGIVSTVAAALTVGVQVGVCSNCHTVRSDDLTKLNEFSNEKDIRKFSEKDLALDRRMMALATERRDELSIASEISMLLNKQDFAKGGVQDYIRLEIKGLINAAIEADIIKIPLSEKDFLIKKCQDFVLNYALSKAR